MNILIVEDDLVIAKQLQKLLQNWGYNVDYISDFTDVVSQVEQMNPHLILLDLNLPNRNGFSICQEIRKNKHTPIIFISSSDEEMNFIMAVNSGGDDFVNKPFDFNVLVAKIQALLRRTYEFVDSKSETKIGNLIIDFDCYSIQSNGLTEELTKNECIILKVLYDHSPKVVSRDVIMNCLWNNDSFIDDNALNVNINRLRKKLKSICDQELIKTKKGLGYYLCED